MKISEIKIGDKVAYCSVVGFKITSENHEVKSIEPMPNNYGCDVVFITGKSGCVDVEHLLLM